MDVFLVKLDSWKYIHVGIASMSERQTRYDHKSQKIKGHDHGRKEALNSCRRPYCGLTKGVPYCLKLVVVDME